DLEIQKRFNEKLHSPLRYPIDARDTVFRRLSREKDLLK
ncbi:hypothetical protein FO519_010003, partial [Halicephalobus sp. NKZ332]